MTYVYVASSWRNAFQPAVISVLKAANIPHYDFRNPPNSAGFGWEEVMPNYVAGSESVHPRDYLRAIDHPRALEGFNADFGAMKTATHVLLVLPCNRSAHLELGWAVGANKQTCVLLSSESEPMVPELMYRMVDYIAPNVFDMLGWLGVKD